MSFLILTLWGCSAFDTERTAAVQYLDAVQPLMVENRLLTDETLALAAKVHDESIPDEGIAPQWNARVVPIAQHLADQSAQIEVPPQWVDLHANLTSIWADRAIAYRDMGDAITLADQDKWTSAITLQSDVIQREQAWFSGVESNLSPMKLHLEQYP